ncbi:hypothetical protein SAMN04487898_105140 [Pedobacter sp. ok626]|uniref:hypothetical protein n=1 Tax=Pedobacter sp. ok626 TaxID=1761882 RepID=UPI00088B0CE9|nr:hypothetical protein [Pedobacter sp. ok626]SDJ95376.1 hypothetical protein SAMN04487898_105140 [Pedobacter sp. ok626]
MEYTIETGDRVRHKNPLINSGLETTVIDVENGKALCGHFDRELTHKESWFEVEDLHLISKSDGSFLDM